MMVLVVTRFLVVALIGTLWCHWGGACREGVRRKPAAVSHAASAEMVT